jgi:hypothetical protein
MKYKQNLPARGKPENKDCLNSSSDLKFSKSIIVTVDIYMSLLSMMNRTTNSMKYACRQIYAGKIRKDIQGSRTKREIQNRDREFPGKNWLIKSPVPTTDRVFY